MGTDQPKLGRHTGTADEDPAQDPTAHTRPPDALPPAHAGGLNDAPAPGSAPTGGTADAGQQPDEAAERWQAFGPVPERVLSRPRRITRAIGRVLTHEWTLACLASLVLAVLMTWPTLRYPAHTIPQDTWDPTLVSYLLAWSGHALLTDPAQLWHTNSFYPLQWSFAFSETLLGYAPAGLIGTGPTAAVLRYNIVFVLAHALATLGAYALVRQLGARRIAAAVTGVSYAYAPWLLAQAGHLHVLSNGGVPLALAMLARGHGWSLRYGYRPERRHAGWALAGWLVASWQVTIGFSIGLPFAYVLALITLVVPAVFWVKRSWFWSVRRPFGVKLLLTDLFGGAVFAATGLLLSLPYFTVAELHPHAKRTIGNVDYFSPPVLGFFTAPAESRLWGTAHAEAQQALRAPAEMTLLPGFALYGLAIAGLIFSIWTIRQRLLLLAATLLSGVLAMGTTFFGGTYTYLPLFEYLPGWEGLRTPGRLTLWTTLLLGVLAAGAVSAFTDRAQELAAQRVPPWPGPWLRLATLLPLALVLVEGLNVTPHPVVPRQPAVMREASGPLLVLPTDQLNDQHAMLWSTTRFQPLVNGGSGFTPRRLAEVRKVAETFPDRGSVDYLRELGVKTVVLLRDRAAGTPWQAAADLPVDGLGIEREEAGNVVVFTL